MMSETTFRMAALYVFPGPDQTHDSCGMPATSAARAVAVGKHMCAAAITAGRERGCVAIALLRKAPTQVADVGK